MAAVGNSTIRCPICSIELDVPVSATPYEGRSASTMYLSFDLAQVRDHVAEHDLGSPVGVDLPLTGISRRGRRGGRRGLPVRGASR